MSAIAEHLRFQPDLALYNSLIDDATIHALAKKRRQQSNDDAYRRSLLGRSLRISAAIAPQLHHQITAAQARLGLSQHSIEVYIYSSPEANASCAMLSDKRIVLTLSSGLLQNMDSDEVNFVIGHELGHALFEHSSLPIQGILDDGELNANDAMRLMSWSRRAEISADRAGLFVCQNPEAAIRSFLKLSCGLADPVINFDLCAYSEQIKDLGKLANSIDDTAHCYSSHPFNPIRVMAVDAFARSQFYAQLCNKAAAQKTVCKKTETESLDHDDPHQFGLNHLGLNQLDLKQVDDEINAVLDFMEPVADDKKQQLLNECLFWAGAWIAYADGKLASSEAENLRQQVGTELFNLRIQALQKTDDPQALAQLEFERAVIPLNTLAAPEKCALIQRLVVIARADQNIDNRELLVLETIASQLQVDTAFINQIMMFLD